MTALERILTWPHRASAAWVRADGTSASGGDVDEVYEWASVTKLVTALAVWVAVEEGSVAFEDPAGPPGATLAHLLSHSSGVAPDGRDLLVSPGTRRIYSNTGFELAAAHVEAATGIPFSVYATEAVLEPLGMHATTMRGSPAAGARGPLRDLVALAAELQSPTLVDRSTHSRATAVFLPGLPGVLPGFGSQADNAWGLGTEIRASKHPHWTGSANSERTFGHFGRSGSMLWVDPAAGVATVSLSAGAFGEWATRAWPELSDAVLGEVTSPRRAPSP